MLGAHDWRSAIHIIRVCLYLSVIQTSHWLRGRFDVFRDGSLFGHSATPNMVWPVRCGFNVGRSLAGENSWSLRERQRVRSTADT
ncbi:hypothetical protein FF011L_03180 [Roseimaritima multifibrata]|uniref:Uncharacterized protein n=2 Tax=Roseimaritima multifibrata TaxID=1930274 RepID=A0A517M9M2_9BACT|nr:hypothetical protein FF011L_03180 [Roseimaritima multifibrata]